LREVAIKAAQALANKHPDSSIIVRFDANGQLITLTDGLYTPHIAFSAGYFGSC
jgi:hypothetical protein